MKRSFFEQVILYDYRYLISYSLMILVGLYSLFWRLGSLVPGLSRYEADYINSFGPGWDSIASNPLFWPHKLLSQWSVSAFGNTELAWRLPSAALAALGLAAFFLIIRHRFQGRVAMVAILLLATASWWLGAARLARPEILIPVMMFLVVLAARQVYESQSPGRLAWLAWLVGTSLYVPLMPHVILIGGAVSYSIIRKHYAEASRRGYWLGYAILLALVIPLITAVIRDPAVGRELLVLPADWPSFGQLLASIKDSLMAIFWSAKEFTPLNLGTLPFLDLFTAAMVILGLYYLDHEISRSLTQFLLAGFIGLTIIMNLSPQPGFNVVLIPFIYTLVAAGIVMLFAQWYEIFPRNPIARMVAFIPTVVLVLTVVWYHQTRYFVAWAKSPAIVQTFPPLSGALEGYLRQVGPGQTAVALVGEDEVPLARAAAWLYPRVQVTTVAAAAAGQPNLAISHQAYQALDPETLELVDSLGLEQQNSPYQSYPVVLWYTSPQ